MELFGSRAPSAAERTRESYIRRKLTEALASSLRHLEHKYAAAEEAIYSEDSANSVCNVIEAIFMHGLKLSTSVTSKVSTLLIGPEVGKIPQPSFWDVLKKITHRDVISQLNHFGQITTEIGMCRAWIRIALNEGLLESYLDALYQDKPSLRRHYKQTAYLRDEEQRDIMKTFIQCLQAFTFKLSYNSSVLNIWTTTPLVLAGIIEPMVTSRTTTAVINKVASSANAASAPSPASAASPSSAPTGDADAASGAAGGLAQVEVTHNRSSKSRPSRVISAIGYVSETPEGTSMPATPPNTPFNSGMLTQTDIDIMRRMSRHSHQAGSTSTPTSQISIPDPSGREEPNLPFQRFMNDSKVNTDYAAVSEESNEEYFDSQQVFDNVGQAASGDEETDDTGIDTEVFRIMTVPLADEKSNASETASNQGEASSEDKTTDGATGAADRAGRSPSRGSKEGNLSSRQSPAFLHIRRKSLPLEPEEVKVTAESDSYDEVGQAASPSNQEQASYIFEPSIYDQIRMPTPQSNNLGSGQMRGWSSEFEDADDEQPRVVTNKITMKYESNDGTPSNETTDQQSEDPSNTAAEEVFFARLEASLTPQEVPVYETKFGETKTEPVMVAAKNSSHVSEASGQSYDDLLNSYGPSVQPVGTPNMDEVLDALGPSSSSHESHSTREDPLESMECPADYEILAVGPSCNEDLHHKQLASIIGVIANEKGLDSQNFQCRACSRPIGIIYGNPRLCTYDACYYCFECHENEEYYIPSRIVYNWDFTKFNVCTSSLQFLKEVEELPMLNIQQLNPRLYEHVRDMKEALDVRTQLRYLKAYLFTCKQSVADELRKQVWPKEYLYEDVHLYSLQDLLQIQAGYFCGGIRKLVKFACRHVYDCRLCSQKGFICEICQNPKVIYPFEMETTSRCDVCQSVYHKNCMLSKPPCPKCERLRRRSLPPDPEAMDYACLPDDS